jgi:hypothetical protein
MKRMYDTTEPQEPAKGMTFTMHLNDPLPHQPKTRGRGSRYQNIDDVLNDASLNHPQKRAILASWASDLWAIESCPWLREVPGVRTPLRVSDIFAALRALDDSDPPPKGANVLAFSTAHKSRSHVRPQPAEMQHDG